MADAPACPNCRYYPWWQFWWWGGNKPCLHPKAEPNPINGATAIMLERHWTGGCGPDGKHFERR